ncbi:MAG: response regulator transcription factor [Arcobacteraceae bacterium]|nr:response regulator transcription factor [Arcobacteraceae bacterium]
MDKLTQLFNISNKLTILYVEDDMGLRIKSKAIFDNLFKQVDLASDGENGLLQYDTYFYETNNYYDIVITDLRMPKVDGLSLVKKILEQNKNQKIIVTSAYGEKDTLINFINLGVTKFIQKPFTMDEIVDLLLEVVESLVENSDKNNFILGENLFWNKIFKELIYEGKVIKLSHNETTILNTLVNNPNKIFSQFDLNDLVVSEDENKELSQDSLKSMIKRLRQKLPCDIIQNIYAKGYKLQIAR